MQRTSTNNSMSELQKRYTERAKLKAEEKDLVQMIEKTKAQLTQLQVEALDIKSRIRTTSQNEKTKKKSGKTEGSVENVRTEDPNEYEEEERQLELDLNTNNEVLEKMMRGHFSTNDMVEEDEEGE